MPSLLLDKNSKMLNKFLEQRGGMRDRYCLKEHTRPCAFTFFFFLRGGVWVGRRRRRRGRVGSGGSVSQPTKSLDFINKYLDFFLFVFCLFPVFLHILISLCSEKETFINALQTNSFSYISCRNQEPIVSLYFLPLSAPL